MVIGLPKASSMFIGFWNQARSVSGRNVFVCINRSQLYISKVLELLDLLYPEPRRCNLTVRAVAYFYLSARLGKVICRIPEILTVVLFWYSFKLLDISIAAALMSGWIAGLPATSSSSTSEILLSTSLRGRLSPEVPS